MAKRLQVSAEATLPDDAFAQGAILAKVQTSFDNFKTELSTALTAAGITETATFDVKIVNPPKAPRTRKAKTPAPISTGRTAAVRAAG